jgi:NAD(P)H dehydrogenase (quinone)
MPAPQDSSPTLITGAGGSTGGKIAKLLLEHGRTVRAFVHTDDERAHALADAGAELVIGDLTRRDDVAKALEGIGSAYLVYPLKPGLLEATATFAEAAAEAQIAAIVNMSQVSAHRNSLSTAAQQHWIAERLLDRYPTPVTHIRPTFFAEWFFYFGASIATDDVIRLPMANGRHAPIATAEQARVIAAILEHPEMHAGKTYPLFGPEEMDHYEIARVFSSALGRTITYEPIEISEFVDILRNLGRSDYLIQHLSEVIQNYRGGQFAGTNDITQRIAQSESISLRQFILTNRQRFERSATHPIPPPHAS